MRLLRRKIINWQSNSRSPFKRSADDDDDDGNLANDRAHSTEKMKSKNRVSNAMGWERLCTSTPSPGPLMVEKIGLKMAGLSNSSHPTLHSPSHRSS